MISPGRVPRHRRWCSKARREGTPALNDGTGLAEALLGLDGFKVLEVSEVGVEVVIASETAQGRGL